MEFYINFVCKGTRDLLRRKERKGVDNSNEIIKEKDVLFSSDNRLKNRRIIGNCI